ncbi:calcium-binding protein [Nocardioides sp.]|uniref:calcium-binding protein n=1 Tax=Nocardioides sp. TaxID=35761 RepID=UPI002BB9503E|nr:calcium-binding protein [Nocardioides sp.]HXH77457.1 calcium-binding protein [Nocardioides sp.]
MRNTIGQFCLLPVLAGLVVACAAPADQTDPVDLSCEGRVATIVADQKPATEPQSVIGTPGDDVILGSDGDDLIDGGTGNDVICGLGGADALTGGEGDDRLFGGTDDGQRLVGKTDDGQRLVGGTDDGQRYLDGTSFVVGDTLIPGPGNDHLDAGWDPRQTLYGGWQELDTVDFSSATVGIDADLAAGVVTGQGSDTVVAHPHQRIIATAYTDRITGSASAETIYAGGGADVVDPGAGSDLIFLDSGGPEASERDHATDTAIGGDGNDVVFSDGGNDTISTGAGNDKVHTGSAGEVRIDTGAGNDNVFARSSGARLDGGAGRDRFTFDGRRLRGQVTLNARAGTLVDEGHFALRLSGWESYSFDTSKSPLRFYGSGRDERFEAYFATRVIAFGRGGDDVLYGRDGPDRLLGGTGTDRASAYDGRDLCVGIEAARGCEIVR